MTRYPKSGHSFFFRAASRCQAFAWISDSNFQIYFRL